MVREVKEDWSGLVIVKRNVQLLDGTLLGYIGAKSKGFIQRKLAI